MAEKITNNSELFKKSVHQALRAWHTSGGTPENLLSSLLQVQTRRMELNAEGSPALMRLATNEVLLQGIEELAVQDETAARVLNLRFPANKSLLMVAHQLNVSDHTVSRQQREAINQLAHILQTQEAVLRQAHMQKVETSLPPPTYSEMFGVTDISSSLHQQIIISEAPWVLALVGIGGIGKTALTNYVVRQIVSDFCFEDIIWLRVPPQNVSSQPLLQSAIFERVVIDLGQYFWADSVATMPFSQQLVQVRQRLKAQPYLIIIDNLESESDTAHLLNSLYDVANPSKFILTTRTRLVEQGPVFNIVMDELSLTDAAALLRHHADDIGVQAMASATLEDMQSIYKVVGGNPLALKLVVGLLDLLPLPKVLSNLTQSQPGQIEDMYRHIYWQTWQLLSLNARQLLQALPLVAEFGGTLEYLLVLSGMKEAEIWPALQELRLRSLLEVRGNLQEKRYGIHRLTETFLHTEIIHWPIGE